MRPLRIALFVTLASLFLAACAQTPPPDPVTITIEMSEYAFSPSVIELQVGQEVTLILENNGQLEHELMIGREVHRDAGVPNGYNADFWHVGGVMPTLQGGGQLMVHTDDHGQGGEPTGEHDGHDMSAMTSPEDEDPLMVFLPVGAEPATLTFTVTEEMVGDWEMGCFELQGVHYTAGMVGRLTVKP